MSHSYEADRIASEKPDPREASSTRFMAVPLTLWSALIVFGCCYLGMHTAATSWSEGDKRSPVGAVTPNSATTENLSQLGAEVYKKNCQACHQPTGLGVGSAFPPLKGSEWVLGAEELVPAIVAHGISGEIQVAGKTFKGAMPPFKAKLTPQEIAAVSTHVRSSWGNQASDVTPQTVERVLQQTGDRAKPWAGGAELKEQVWK